MRFIDEVNIKVQGGKGGNGAISWRREASVPMGGPDGGNGGNGGAVIFQVDDSLNTLIDFSFISVLKAEDGVPGGIKQMYGADGADLIKKVPLGTEVYFQDKLIADLSSPGAVWVAARGGRGGKGNEHFKSSTNQAPHFAQQGQKGEEFQFKLVLKSVADVGLIGLPNVGKSTLISKISKAHPKIADYPFTTLVPHLGVLMLSNERRLVIADIPGLIPDAHLGKGLGHTFLKHVERTSVLAQLIDLSIDKEMLENDVSDDLIIEKALFQFEAIENELFSFSEKLKSLPRLIVFSKNDLSCNERAYELAGKLFREKGFQTLSISSHTGSGLEEFNEVLYKTIHGESQN